MRLLGTQSQHHQGWEYQKTKGLISENNNSACFLDFGHFSNNSYRRLNKVVECQIKYSLGMCTQLLCFSCMTTRMPFKIIVKNNTSYIAIFFSLFHSSDMTFMFSNGKTMYQLSSVQFIIIQMHWVLFPHPHHQMQKICTNHHHHCQCQHLQRICTRLLHHRWMSHPGHLKTTLRKVC